MRAFSLKCFLPGNVVTDLNINLLAASLSNKVDLLLIELADIDIVSTATLPLSNAMCLKILHGTPLILLIRQKFRKDAWKRC